MVRTAVEERYPGELAALRGLLGQVRVIVRHGTIGDLRAAVHDHDATERAELEAPDWAPPRRYVGELGPLRELLGRVRAIARNGTIGDLRAAVHDHDATERAEPAAVHWAPEVGAVYRLRAGEVVIRVIDGGVWRKGTRVGDRGLVRTFERLQMEHEGYKSAIEDDQLRVGRLMLRTTGGLAREHTAEVGALRAFHIPPIPQPPQEARDVLAAVRQAGQTAGLVLTVYPAWLLVEMGERDR